MLSSSIQFLLNKAFFHQCRFVMKYTKRRKYGTNHFSFHSLLCNRNNQSQPRSSVAVWYNISTEWNRIYVKSLRPLFCKFAKLCFKTFARIHYVFIFRYRARTTAVWKANGRLLLVGISPTTSWRTSASRRFFRTVGVRAYELQSLTGESRTFSASSWIEVKKDKGTGVVQGRI